MADIEKTEAKASDKAVEKKTEKKPAKNKVSFGEKVKKFFRDYKSELKKIVWSTPQQTLNNTILVAVSVVVVGVCVSLLDLAFNAGLTALGRII